MVDPIFLPLLQAFDLSELAAEPSTVYALDGALRLRYFNDGWRRFARDNGGDAVLRRWPLGASVLDAAPPPLRRFYEALFEDALAGRARDHTYECSSAGLFRSFRMRLLSLADGAGLLVIHDLIQQGPAPGAESADPARYRTAHGLIVQCCHCRRVRRPEEPLRWDWVPVLVASATEQVSHGLCAICLAHYYPAEEATSR